MEVLITSDYEAMSHKAAEFIIALVEQEPEAVIILPSGETPHGTYNALVTAHKKGRVNFSHITAIALDEWGGRSRSHPQSCHQMIATSFVEQVGIPPQRFHSLDGAAADPAAECGRYESLLTKLNRPALSLLGLGTNGHIALNEPAPNLSIHTHVVPLAATTLARAKNEVGGQPVQPYGLTLGMAQILSANKVLLLASGRHKQTAVKAMRSGPITTTHPASLLHLHPNTLVILDDPAAGT